MKKAISMILAISMLSSLIFIFDISAKGERVVVDGIEYTLYDTYCVVTGYDEKTSGKLIIPDHITYEKKDIPVTEIGVRAFEDCLRITNVIVPNSVTSIGDCAFAGCTKLESIILSNSLTKLSYNLFTKSGLTSISIPNGVAIIDGYAFASCTNLKSVIIPDTVNKIEYGAFIRCSSIEKVIYLESSEYWNKKVIINDENDFLINNLIFHPEHIFDKKIVIKAATCEGEDGEIERICTTCGYSERYVVKGGHVLSEIKTNDKNHWYDCERCGEKINLGSHTYEEHILKKSNCTEDGQKEYVCTVCGYTKNSIIEKTGHSLGELKYDENEHWHDCTKCGEILEITPHTYGDENILKKPTCTENGKAEHTCTVCGYLEQYTISALGHKPKEIKQNEEKHWYICETCGESLNVEQHTYDEHIIKNASCTEDGIAEFVCSICGYTEQHVLDAIGHKLGEINHNDKKHWYECENCGERIDVNSHIYEERIIKKASCTEDGITEYVCSECGYTENSVTEKLNHLQGDLECDEHNHWCECTRCGMILEIENHTFGNEHIIKYPTYEKNGEAEHICTKCGYVERYAIESVKYEQNEIEDGILNIVIGENITAAPGDIIDVKIRLVNNNGISSVKIILTYDPRLSIVMNENDDPCAELDIADLSDESMQRAVTFREDDNILILNWLSAEKEVIGDVTYATVKFKVDESTEDYEFLPIMANVNPNDVFDIDKNNVNYNIVCNGIKIRALNPGDINDDGELNNKDVVLLFRYVSSGDIYEDEYVLDFSGDGNVDNKDVVSLFRFVSSK